MQMVKSNGLLIFSVIIFISSIELKIIKDDISSGSSLKNVNALVIIDVQYCFINGSLSLSNGPARQNGLEVIPIINRLIENIPFDVIVYSLDWHPINHISFIENLQDRKDYLLNEDYFHSQVFDTVIYTGPKYQTEQVLWPAHCIENSDEAQLHDDLIRIPASSNVIYIRKGIDPDIDSYSAFADNQRIYLTSLNEQLKSLNVTHLFLTGLALDYCVASTAIDAIHLNYQTYVIEDACRGVNQETIQYRFKQFRDYGINLIQSYQVRNIIQGKSLIDKHSTTCSQRQYFNHIIEDISYRKRNYLEKSPELILK